MALLWMGEHDDLNREVVGGKAHSLNRMHRLGLPVPPAFVLTTDECARFFAAGERLGEDLLAQVRRAVHTLEERTGRRFGDTERPLLVSVRSGAARSMPGMMDTILNLGINDEVEAALRTQTQDAGYASGTHRRFTEQFESVVGQAAPPDPWEQLIAAIGAVFRSWRSPRAVAYRRHHGIGDDGGTSVTVQAMVFGNLDDFSGTGVLFTRNPLTGESDPYGEWLPRGQGEDVVSGRHDPLPLSALAEQQPQVHRELLAAAARLEEVGKDVQDIEFTVESGKLWLLQARPAKRSPDAAVRLAVALHADGLLTAEVALSRVTSEQVAAVCRPRVAPEAKASATLVARGEPACPGVGIGRVVLEVEEAEELADSGVEVVLARPTTDPDDVSGMIVSSAILTEIGGSTSHAAVVSRELGTPCVVGCGQGELAALAGRQVTVDGTTGEVFEGALPLAPCTEADNPALAALLSWARALVPGVDGSPAAVFQAARDALAGKATDRSATEPAAK
ncbi:pyruvate, phosphate dikinase [Actinomadura sp. NBRC 104425]|uniref:pyruvate, phosphate dikinase n=1 Tax=Actinomadura sp. NBRC 104425 TaxID=3032204 RepID=UPI00249FED68|nr:pyruvate, phosphate dikinase [Actinomadura sp. NBRC 104425]GLZ15961.1 pyruvate, phosphate dikinase [Actinomadura sp. NBRC 104425]